MENNKSYLGEGGRFFLHESNGQIDSSLLHCTEHGRILQERINLLFDKTIRGPLTIPMIIKKDEAKP